jgi:hypothetical protein
MYHDPFYDSALDAGVELLSSPALGLMYPTISEADRGAMQAQASTVLEQLRAFYAAPTDDARASLHLAVERLAALAYTCADDTALGAIDNVDAFGWHLGDPAQALALPPLATLEKELQDLITNALKLETECERDQRHCDGRLTADEWQCERDTRETWRALDAQFSADTAADYATTRYW